MLLISLKIMKKKYTMSFNLLYKKPFIPPNPHFISLDLLEFSNINIPLKKEVYIFDIDGTLYSDTTHLNHMVAESIILLSKHFNIPLEQAKQILTFAHDESNNGIKKCMIDYQLQSKFYIDIHLALIKKECFVVDETLKDLLLKLKKDTTLICFTNGTEMNSRYILEALGISEAFDLVISNDYLKESPCKPQRIAYDMINNSLDLRKRTEKVVFFDDDERNCQMGIEVGWETHKVTTERNLVQILKEIVNIEMK